jgi:hypothetical protein
MIAESGFLAPLVDSVACYNLLSHCIFFIQWGAAKEQFISFFGLLARQGWSDFAFTKFFGLTMLSQLLRFI